MLPTRPRVRCFPRPGMRLASNCRAKRPSRRGPCINNCHGHLFAKRPRVGLGHSSPGEPMYSRSASQHLMFFATGTKQLQTSVGSNSRPLPPCRTKAAHVKAKSQRRSRAAKLLKLRQQPHEGAIRILDPERPPGELARRDWPNSPGRSRHPPSGKPRRPSPGAPLDEPGFAKVGAQL